MRRVLICGIFIGAALAAVTVAQPQNGPEANEFALQPGDLLFQSLDCGDLCDAIYAVTEGRGGANFAHVGMVTETSGNDALIIESVGAFGVVETPLREYLAKAEGPDGAPRVVVGRLDADYQELIPDAIEAARERLGKPYDPVYLIDNGAYYCSELLYEAFREANDGEPLFQLEPMTFKEPETGVLFPAWEDHYANLNEPVPEGEPGLNPGGMSNAPFIEIVHVYGAPGGWSDAAGH